MDQQLIEKDTHESLLASDQTSSKPELDKIGKKIPFNPDPRKLTFRFINPVTIEYDKITQDIGKLVHIEDFLFKVLRWNFKVGPICRHLFGFRLISDESIWLAPNYKLRDLLNIIDDHDHDAEPCIELRFRFRPASYSKIATIDRETFNLIFAQVRYDFLKTKIFDQHKDYLILDNAVLGLMATDLLRHALKNDIDIEDIFKHVEPDEFIPCQTPKWQRSLLFRLKKKLSIHKSIKIGYMKSNKDVLEVERTFLDHFFTKVCPNYGAETFRVYLLDDPTTILDIRLRYNQTNKDSSCSLETRVIPFDLKRKTKPQDYKELCDIIDISSATVHDKYVMISYLETETIKIAFPSHLYALSFVSLLDGYQRLCAKWNFNLSKSITSPYLNNLYRTNCHGPIGYRSVVDRLRGLETVGAYLIRQCMDNYDIYMVDILIGPRMILTVNVGWFEDEASFRVTSHSCNVPMNTVVKSEGYFYDTIDNFARNLEITIVFDAESYNYLQPTIRFPPSPFDDCPALLISISKSRLARIIAGSNSIPDADRLPKLIPAEILKYTDKKCPRTDNRMMVRYAIYNEGQEVIVKDHIDAVHPQDQGPLQITHREHRVLDLTSYGVGHSKLFNNLKPAQFKLSDWVYIDHNLFAKTIGIEPSRSALVQEALNLGPLDVWLRKLQRPATRADKLSISTQLACALKYLQEKNYIHGKIRCNNIHLTSLNPIHIKITDPLGTYDTHKEMAFLAPEYLGSFSVNICMNYFPGMDIWAAGTTIWQVFSNGAWPPEGTMAYDLAKPDDCTGLVWDLIQDCWRLNFFRRISPQVLFRDLEDVALGNRLEHDYDLIPDENRSLYRCDNSSKSIDSYSDITSTSRNSGIFRGRFYYLKGRKRISDRHIPLEIRGPIICPVERDSSSDNQVFLSDVGSTSMLLESSSRESSSDHSWLVDIRNVRLGRELGKGCSGQVFKAQLFNHNGKREQTVAVKCINTEESEVEYKVDDLRREFQILKNLEHKNIVKALGFIEGESPKLIFEFVPFGDLLTLIRESTLEFCHNILFEKFAYDISRGMEYLARKKIVHRDLALRNILLKSRDEVKICDFGLAQCLGRSNYYKLKSNRALPLLWYAPETLRSWLFTTKSDVWSYGITLWEMYSGGKRPRYSGNYEDLLKTLEDERLDRPRGCPKHMYDIMMSCWAYNPEEREDFTQICDRLDGKPVVQLATSGDSADKSS